MYLRQVCCSSLPPSTSPSSSLLLSFISRKTFNSQQSIFEHYGWCHMIATCEIKFYYLLMLFFVVRETFHTANKNVNGCCLNLIYFYSTKKESHKSTNSCSGLLYNKHTIHASHTISLKCTSTNGRRRQRRPQKNDDDNYRPTNGQWQWQ